MLETMPSNEPTTRLGTGRIVALLLVGTLTFLVIALVAPWIWQTFRGASGPAAMAAAPLAGLPWQIERRPDGSSLVFGLDLGHGTLQQVTTRWPDEKLELALVRDPQGVFTLEGYLENIRAGWVTTLAGEAGKKLEAFHGPLLAAQLIYRESGYAIHPARFFDGNSAALEDMKRLAEAL